MICCRYSLWNALLPAVLKEHQVRPSAATVVCNIGDANSCVTLLLTLYPWVQVSDRQLL